MFSRGKNMKKTYLHMNSNFHKLNNPVWHSLSESHQKFSMDYGGIKFYHPDYCAFGGIEDAKDISRHLEEYSTMANDFFIVGEKPILSSKMQFKKELVCMQMVIEKKIDSQRKEDITLLTSEHTAVLSDLINLVQPGYFKFKTPLLGNYSGILKNNQLIAVTGERMKMNDFTELSAIVTHPNHTGQGYAKQLIAHAANNIFDQNKTPYLHVAETNIGAITLYKKLGFTTRKQISFWNITNENFMADQPKIST